MVLETITAVFGSNVVALVHILFGALVLVFPGFLRIIVGLYFISLGLLYFL